MNTVDKFIAAVSESGIPCYAEFSEHRTDVSKGTVCAFVGVKKLSFADGASSVSEEIRITLQGGMDCTDGTILTDTAENIVVPAVKSCAESITKAEISEVKLNSKTGMLYCETVFTAASADPLEEKPDPTDFVIFNGVKIYAPEYSVSRSALTSETALISGGTVLHFGGGGIIKIKMKGFADSGAAVKLDALLRGGGKFTLNCMGASFADIMLSKYSCESDANLDKAELEFLGSSPVVQIPEQEV